ncbi:hypothetical protein ANCDUO_05609 [Ancylostoma duodenale]|uniref:Uncharacterized protein n=1 Tax=Ancylostoma duodenale TaxID=51022 RepID=A0A0C2H3T0_9BILA|nr:hypothetical protein ANCDUO_05609 [Ancylostoma duodenale]
MSYCLFILLLISLLASQSTAQWGYPCYNCYYGYPYYGYGGGWGYGGGVSSSPSELTYVEEHKRLNFALLT